MNASILDYGAISDPSRLNTQAIQRAIDAVHTAGGGRVTVPSGLYITGMIYLKSRVELHLEPGSLLKAAPRPEDHPKRKLNVAMPWNGGFADDDRFHLLAAVECEDIAITGLGTLDGNGPNFYPPTEHPLAWPLGYPDARRMGTTVQIERCRNVRISDITITNVSFWTLHLAESDTVTVRGIRICNPHNAPNADGIDITGCRGVTISDCHIDTCDDAICLKTFPMGRSCENVVVTNCVIRTHCVGLKLGCNESFQDIRNVTFSNCVIWNSHRAIGIYSFHGKTFENISISNIVCDTRVPLMFTRPIHIEATHRAPGADPGCIRNVAISQLYAKTNGRILLVKSPGATLENVSLRDITLDYVTVDDPAIKGATVGGAQFASLNPWVRTERAALVAEGVRDLSIDGLIVRWPREVCPPDWRFDRKAANGSHDLYGPADWGADGVTPFAAVSVKGIQGGHLRTERLTAYGNEKSAVKVVDSIWNVNGDNAAQE
jgi:hypothetical protein